MTFEGTWYVAMKQGPFGTVETFTWISSTGEFDRLGVLLAIAREVEGVDYRFEPKEPVGDLVPTRTFEEAVAELDRNAVRAEPIRQVLPGLSLTSLEHDVLQVVHEGGQDSMLRKYGEAFEKLARMGLLRKEGTIRKKYVLTLEGDLARVKSRPR